MVLSLQEHLIIFSTNRRVSRYPLETLGWVILRVHFESQVVIGAVQFLNLVDSIGHTNNYVNRS